MLFQLIEVDFQPFLRSHIAFLNYFVYIIILTRNPLLFILETWINQLYL
jgi:hypothetical protein